MPLEIERRFLVQGEQWRRHCRWSQVLRQGYLVAAGDGLTLRVRTARLDGAEQAAEAWLTLKAPLAGQVQGLARHEFEYRIPITDAETMLALAPSGLAKRRYGLDLAGGDWVLDVFEGANAPLVVAEVELTDPNQPLPIPEWCVLEISGRHDLSNAALSRLPLAAWSAPARESLLAALVEQPHDPS